MADHSSQDCEVPPTNEKSYRFAVRFREVFAQCILPPMMFFAFGIFAARKMPWLLSSGLQARWFEHPMIVAWALMFGLPFAIFGLIRLTKALRIEISEHSMTITERTILRSREVVFPLAAKPGTQFHRQREGYWCIEILLQKPFRFGHGFGNQLYEIFGIIETALGRDPADALKAI